MVCFINKNPRYCYQDTTLNAFVIRFKDGLNPATVGNPGAFVSISCVDPNDKSKDGFFILDPLGIRFFEIELFDFTNSITYYIQP
jgi:hypothetical protein